MEILKAATEWAKDEIFSSKFFILFGILFIIATIGFWKLAKTDVAKAFVYPTLVVGVLLLIIGTGLLFVNKSRLENFPKEYKNSPSEFVQNEIIRAEKTVKEYKNVVFTAIPIIIIVASLLIIFIDKPIWRAICITTIAMMAVILLVDSNASKRMKDYNEQLKLVDIKTLKK